MRRIFVAGPDFNVHVIVGWALFLKHILHISYFEDLILLILMVCFFLHITYRNLVEFSLL